MKSLSVSLLQLHLLCAQRSELKPRLDSIAQAALHGSALKTAPGCLQADKALPSDLAGFELGFGKMMGRKTQRVGREPEMSPGRNKEVSSVLIDIGERRS